MSTMTDQIRAAMSPPVVADGEIQASCVLGPDFVGFRGHFPGRPILPAICQVQAALILLETALRRTVKLREIERARFSAPAGPDERLEIRCVVDPREARESVVRTTVSRGDATLARFRLRVAAEGED